MPQVDIAFLAALLVATIRIAAPLLLAGLGETVAERAGVVNIGLEGTMLMGAFAAFIVAYATQSDVLGVGGGMVAGAAVTMLLGYICILRAANQVITGLVINIFALGITTFLYRAVFTLNLPTVPSMPAAPVPLLSALPFAGPIVFQQTALVYLAFLAVPLAAFVIYHTHLGLCLRAAGEHPAALDAAGVSVYKVRFIALLLCGVMAGIAGAALSIGQLSRYTDNLVAGRGYIALALVLLGRWDPVRLMVAAMLFGAADAAQLRLQLAGSTIPPEFLGMVPYLAAIAAMALFATGLRMPAALAQPYLRDQAT
jgi:simple sugar transport system permease protein